MKRIFSSILVWIFFAPLALIEAQESSALLAQRADSLFKSGVDFFQKKQIESAAGEWKKALEIFTGLNEKKAALRLYGNLALTAKILNQNESYRNYLQKQIELSLELKDQKTQAGALSALGALDLQFNQYASAESSLVRALEIQRSAGEKKDEAQTLSRLGLLYQANADYPNSLDRFIQAASIRDHLKDRMELSNDWLGIGTAYRSMSQYDSAMTYYRRALALKDSVKDIPGKANTLTQIGIVFDYLGKTNLAEQFYRESYELNRALKNEKGMADNATNLGVLNHNNGRYQEAIDAYKEALAVYNKYGLKRSAAKILANTAVVYRDLNDDDEALKYLLQAVAIEKEIADKQGLASHYGIIGSIYYKRADYFRATDFIHQSIAIKREIGDKRGESNDLISLGAILLQDVNEESAVMDQSQALSILDYFQQALVIKRQIGDIYGQVTALTYLGQTYRIMKDFAKAKEHYLLAYDMAVSKKASTLKWQIKYGLAKTYQRDGQLDEAKRNFEEALLIIEDQRTQLGSEEFRTGFFQDKIYVYADLIETLVNQNDLAEAFHVVERSKSRSFLDLLGTKALETARRENSDVARLDSIDKRMAILEESFKDRSLNETQLAGYLTESEELTDLRKQLLATIKKNNEELSSLLSVSPLKLSETQAMLDKDVTMLEYYVTPKFYLIFVISKTGIECVKKEIPGIKLYRMLLDFRNDLLTVDKPNYKKSSQNLYELLIAPALAHIKTERLIVVPYGKLHYIPFSALMSEKEEFLIDQYSLSYLPSASLMKFILKKRKAVPSSAQSLNLLAFGNPVVPNMSPLASAESEVKFIGGLFGENNIFLRGNATESVMKKEIAHSEILHFACHGVFDLDNPSKSGIFLTQDTQNDGKVLVDEIFSLKLDRAQLVVLSACETGLSRVTQGDELIGLTRAFIYAGTPALISSLWQVSDASTEFLIKGFYEQFRSLRKSDALRQAQLKLKAQPEFAHPYFWSSFGLVGDWK